MIVLFFLSSAVTHSCSEDSRVSVDPWKGVCACSECLCACSPGREKEVEFFIPEEVMALRIPSCRRKCAPLFPAFHVSRVGRLSNGTEEEEKDQPQSLFESSLSCICVPSWPLPCHICWAPFPSFLDKQFIRRA